MLTFDLAKTEPLTRQLNSLTDESYHLPETLRSEKPEMRIKATLNPQLQQLVNEALIRHYKQLAGNQFNHAAAIVAEVRSGRVLAYIGKAPISADNRNGNHVDIIHSLRRVEAT